MLPSFSTELHVDDVVRLVHGVPHVGLRSGEIGVVQSLWFEPQRAYEVEFRRGGIGVPLRVILLRNELTLEERAPHADLAEAT